MCESQKLSGLVQVLLGLRFSCGVAPVCSDILYMVSERKIYPLHYYITSYLSDIKRRKKDGNIILNHFFEM